MSEAPDQLSIPVWFKSGGMRYRRDCLEPNHPEHTYNYIKREFGVNPEDYGIERPEGYTETCPNCGCVFDTRMEDK